MLSGSEFLLSLASVACWGFAGTLSRLGFDWILKAILSPLSPDPSPIGGDFLSNMVGCLVMGFLSCYVELKQSRRWKLVYLGLTSGFCGSLTTFSGWQVQAAQSMLRGHVAAGVLNLVISFMTFYFCLLAGEHFGKMSRALFPAKKDVAKPQDAQQDQGKGDAAVPPVPPEPSTPLNVGVLVVATLLWIVFGVLYAVVPLSRRWTGPAFLTPFGVGLRWYTSIWNPQCPRFKWPTFSVNVFGVLVYTIVLVCESKYTGAPDSVRTTAFVAITAGFCGSLTTASTFFLELYQISPRYFADIYALTSTLTAQTIALVIISIAKFGFKISAL